jgi:hypothetical protein
VSKLLRLLLAEVLNIDLVEEATSPEQALASIAELRRRRDHGLEDAVEVRDLVRIPALLRSACARDDRVVSHDRADSVGDTGQRSGGVLSRMEAVA